MDASQKIDALIAGLTDWRGPALAKVRRLVQAADAEVTEEWKWMGTPTWSHAGILCLANAHKKVVKVTFPKGAQLPDPKKVFNNGLGGNAWRSLDIAEGATVDEAGLKGLVRAALALNLSGAATPKAKAAKPPAAKKTTKQS